MTKKRHLALALAAIMATGGCGWVNHQIDHAMNGGPMAKKPLPGLTADQARARVISYLQESLKDFPDGWSYAYYAIGDHPGDSGFRAARSGKVNDYGDPKESPYNTLVTYWVHYPEGTAEEAFDKLAAYWTAHAHTTDPPHIPPKTGVSDYLRDASFATADHYSFDLAVNQNHALSTTWSTPYYAYDPNDNGYMPETITKNGASAFGEPPK
ncbi:hypothetical protein Srot_2574 [Segniliparus rotundus DSM 44985]|uniref:Lipoprotein n=1 Tax=Segniliparus rotundus (strain ATCC BAA-972 / CDC 1076 / CIP 108378 / DSM 44985 / JCM 13578) TaxID=640132 RepID=D6ZC42_SEGRD|nr:hypothetical protein [Segniliparus rotundus]ADG99011.1 hypothetical protein Srot_2574 [Segniliparus rotundus DSM 44985]